MNGSARFFAIILIPAVILAACAGPQNVSEGKVVEYALTAGMFDGKFTYIGIGGGIKGVSNPVLARMLAIRSNCLSGRLRLSVFTSHRVADVSRFR